MMYKVRDLVFMEREMVKALPRKYDIEFENGEVHRVTSRSTYYSHYYWELIRRYPRVTILPEHHIYIAKGGKPLNDGTHRKMLSRLLESIVQTEKLWRYEQKEPVLKLIYDLTSELMGAMTVETSPNVVSLDILDFVQIAHHPKIVKLKEEAFQNPTKIRSSYDQGIKVIKTDANLKNNNLARALRAGLVSANQVVQCTMFRGYATEVDGTRFPRPIWSNYTQGMNQFYDFVSDSRTAAKSYYYSETPLQDSEYTARQFQLYSSIVEHLVEEDCGNTENTPWLIHPGRVDENNAVVYPGDMEFLIGKYYLDPETGQKGWLTGNESHLVGKTVMLRTILKCRVRNPHYVCRHCAGMLSENISRFANLGHLGTVSTTKQATQNILSIKHVNTSSVALQILLGEHERRFMNTGKTGDAYYLNESLEKLFPTMTIAREEAAGLIDLISQKTEADINIHNISAIKAIGISIQDRDGFRHEPVVLRTTQGNRPSMLSSEMLDYIVSEENLSIDRNNNFQVDLGGWDYNLPALVTSNMEYSYSELAKQIETMVKSNKMNGANSRAKKTRDSPESLLRSLFDLTNSKLKVNILCLEIMIVAMKVRGENDYSMVMGGEEGVLGTVNNLIVHRGLGSALPFEKQEDVILSPASFFQGRRPDSPFDVFFTPREVVEHKRLKAPHNLSTQPPSLNQ